MLASDVKTLRDQMGTLVEKGRHDDELIDALMVRPSARVGNGPSHGGPSLAPTHATCITQEPLPPEGPQPQSPTLPPGM